LRRRLRSSQERPSSRVLIAESEDRVVGCLSAELVLVPYFPNGSTICRVTAIVVSVGYRRRGVGAALLAGAAEFALERAA
jgi:N-acetylglutamate synthase-like GNAT family acetyltransferase